MQVITRAIGNGHTIRSQHALRNCFAQFSSGINTYESEGIRVIQLVRHEELNSLDFKMATDLQTKLSRWSDNDLITCVVLKGKEGYFCGGADLDWLSKNKSKAPEFYSALGNLHKEIAAYPKALVTVLNGDVNGSGLGLANTKFRIVKSDTNFSVPEASFGLVADGAALKMLTDCDKESNLPLASYLALTGLPIHADDMMRFGIATHQLGEENTVDALIYHLASLSTINSSSPASSSNSAFVSETLSMYCEWDQTINIDEIAQKVLTDGVSSSSSSSTDIYSTDEGWSEETKQLMSKSFNSETVEEVWDNLAAKDDEWSQSALAGMQASPPLSLLASKKLISECSKLNMFDSITLAQRVATNLAISKPFTNIVESISRGEDRAPTTLEELRSVTSDEVSELFKP